MSKHHMHFVQTYAILTFQNVAVVSCNTTKLWLKYYYYYCPLFIQCAADMRELIQTAMDRVFELLQPEPLCEYVEVCVAPEVRGEIVPTTQFVDMATEAKEAPPTEEAAADWPIPILNKFKDFKFPI